MPPEPACTCGIYAVDHVGSLAKFIEAYEITQSLGIRHEEQQRSSSDRWRTARLAILRGTLRDPVPQSDGKLSLRPVYNDDLSSTEGISHIALGGTRQLRAMGFHGDPEGTWRGSRFEVDQAVIQLHRVDHEDVYAELFDCERVPVYYAPNDSSTLLSARLKRYAASGRDDQRWWDA